MQVEQQPGTGRRQTVLYRRIVRVMNAGFIIAIGLMLGGLLVALVVGDHVEQETDGLREALPGVLRLSAQDLVEMGILVLLTTPAAYVLVALLTFLRGRDVVFAMICLALLGILSLSVGVTLL